MLHHQQMRYQLSHITRSIKAFLDYASTEYSVEHKQSIQINDSAKKNSSHLNFALIIFKSSIIITNEAGRQRKQYGEVKKIVLTG